jgi:ATP-dependent Clp protease ATP-binding subunit ClpB
VRIRDSALVAAAQLSSRYITDRFLPDKAIDLVDEAAAKLNIEVTSKPQGTHRKRSQPEWLLEGMNKFVNPVHSDACVFVFCLVRAAVDEIDRKLIQLEMAKISLENEEGAESRLRLKDVEKEMQDLQVKQKELTAAWDMERKGVTYIQELKEKIDQVRSQASVRWEGGCALMRG